MTWVAARAFRLNDNCTFVADELQVIVTPVIVADAGMVGTFNDKVRTSEKVEGPAPQEVDAN
jgi:hypothetical protein